MQSQQPLRKGAVAERMPAVELIRRVITGAQPAPEPLPSSGIEALPNALDERVRLLGEW
jgi:hypothetical protein